MEINSLLLPILGGFLFLSIFHRTAYFLAQQSAKAFSLWLAIAGLSLFALARLAVMFCEHAIHQQNAPQNSPPLATLLVSLALPPLTILAILAIGIAGLVSVIPLPDPRSPKSKPKRSLAPIWKYVIGTVLICASINFLIEVVPQAFYLHPDVNGVPLWAFYLASVLGLSTAAIIWARKTGAAPQVVGFRGAMAGILVALALTAAQLNPEVVKSSWLEFASPLSSQVDNEVLGIALLTCVLGPIAALLLNLLYPKAAVLNHILADKSSGALDRLLYRCTTRGRMVMITLSDGKVYCGYADWIPPNPNSKLAHLELTPIFSGYRDTRTKKVELTVNYGEIMEGLSKEERRCFTKIIRMSRIVSANEFDPKYFKTFQHKGATTP